MTWEEDSVAFHGTIRRSGNSLIVTIPGELANRFLIKEGQRVIISGMKRKIYNYEGLIGIHLGAFVVSEKAYGVKMIISNYEGLIGIDMEKGVETIPVIEEIAGKYASTGFVFDRLDEEKMEVKILFGSIGKTLIKPKTRKDIEKILEKLTESVKKAGAKVEEAEIFEEEIEWDLLDPSIIARSPYKDSERISWRWEI